MPKDPYAILRALVRAESLRTAPKPPSGPGPGRDTPKAAPARQTPSGTSERG